jgi:hypothetical protein
MGRVSIRAQWSIITVGVLLSPLFILLMTCVGLWLLFRKLGCNGRQRPNGESEPARRKPARVTRGLG